MLGPSRRSTVVSFLAVCFFVSVWLNFERIQATQLAAKYGPMVNIPAGKQAHMPGPVAHYFNQVFSVEKAPTYDFPALKEHCDLAAKMRAEEQERVVIECGNFFAGMTSIMSEIKVCLKMAVEVGAVGIVLPRIPLRDSTNLKEFNYENQDAYMSYERWFDVDHFKEGIARACPQMKVYHSDDLKKDGLVTNKFTVDVTKAPEYHFFNSHFWAGRPFKQYFDDSYRVLLANSSTKTGPGINVVHIDTIFLLFRITDDPSHRDLRLWNDFGALMRFLEPPRRIVHQLLSQLDGPYYGVHFRVENDTIWSPLEAQLKLDLDALDQAWLRDRAYSPTAPKPRVYLACGDEGQMQKFIEAAKPRGWDVTHKWALAREAPGTETVDMINGLAFDFQGAVDLGLMIHSHFFIGISGSAFSSTVAAARDATGRYRGSSFGGWEDAGANTHLFLDGGPTSYACCL